MRLLGASSVALLATLAVAPAQAQNRSDAITFAKDIAPIFQEKCEICHRAEGMAPMSLETYRDVRPWVRSIKKKVEGRDMPPWYVDKTVGIQKFANDRSLSEHEIEHFTLGRRRRTAGRSARFAEAQNLAGRRCVAIHRLLRPSARPGREVAGLFDASRVAGSLVGGTWHTGHS